MNLIVCLIVPMKMLKETIMYVDNYCTYHPNSPNYVAV